jgi:hypothetical protein
MVPIRGSLRPPDFGAPFSNNSGESTLHTEYFFCGHTSTAAAQNRRQQQQLGSVIAARRHAYSCAKGAVNSTKKLLVARHAVHVKQHGGMCLCHAQVLTISSGFQTPNCTAFTRFTGALLGVKRSMVVAMVAAGVPPCGGCQRTYGNHQLLLLLAVSEPSPLTTLPWQLKPISMQLKSHVAGPNARQLLTDAELGRALLICLPYLPPGQWHEFDTLAIANIMRDCLQVMEAMVVSQVLACALVRVLP